MAQCKLYRFADGTVDSCDVDSAPFGRRSPRRVQREAVLMYQANHRSGTHDTLDRSEIAGTKRKPWRQKGTGRARPGKRNSPIWRSGGVAHGPHPRDYSYHMPRKALRVATRAAVAGKLADGEVVMVDAFGFDAPSTRKAAELLRALGVSGSFLVVLPQHDPVVFKSVRNIPGARVLPASDVNAYEVLSHRTLVVTQQSFELLKERVGAPPAGGGDGE